MASTPHWDSDRRRAGRPLRYGALVLAALALAGAIVIALLPLPKPAAGGTCGPGRGSESAIEAFFDPVTIGAGAEPTPSQSDPVEAARFYQWQAFVGQCQSAANGRMVDALALLIVAGFFALVVPRAVRMAWPDTARRAQVSAGAPPGWYPDPADPRAWRWWDGRLWGQQSAAGSGVPPPAPAGEQPHATATGPGSPEAAPVHPGAGGSAPVPAPPPGSAAPPTGEQGGAPTGP